MRYACILPAMALLAAPMLTRAEAIEYRIDPVHSQVLFNVDHNGFSRSFGRLKITDGVVRFDKDNWPASSVDVTVDLTSVDMGDAAWNAVVRGENLLDAGRAGSAHYASDSVEKTADDEGVVHGRLTLRGITQPLDLPFHVNRIGTTIYGLHTIAGFSSTATLDRTAFGMTTNKNSIGIPVSLFLQVEAIRGGDDTMKTKEPPHAAAQ